MKRMTARIEIGFDSFERPVAVVINDVASIAVLKQLGVVLLTLWPCAVPRADAHFMSQTCVEHRIVVLLRFVGHFITLSDGSA